MDYLNLRVISVFFILGKFEKLHALKIDVLNPRMKGFLIKAKF